MHSKTREDQLLAAIIEKKGRTYQLAKAIEEMGELTIVLTKLQMAYAEGGEDGLSDAMALMYEDTLEERCDVENTLKHLDRIFGFNKESVEHVREWKLERAIQRL